MNTTEETPAENLTQAVTRQAGDTYKALGRLIDFASGGRPVDRLAPEARPLGDFKLSILEASKARKKANEAKDADARDYAEKTLGFSAACAYTALKKYIEAGLKRPDEAGEMLAQLDGVAPYNHKLIPLPPEAIEHIRNMPGVANPEGTGTPGLSER